MGGGSAELRILALRVRVLEDAVKEILERLNNSSGAARHEVKSDAAAGGAVRSPKAGEVAPPVSRKQKGG